ncbi:hypothetical protein FOA43_001551 [Brettanomyces nanus]|uniref:Rho-GAP domain-containing protein n=1 Tax=Eeniella nana TaxID=13502 RepID=A0A875RYK0_EENNA|nr:uncharacterized protein FOA43_001551 [Brettanomyces nanus]QPG74226.1 hypothetical protein FOA43_001551 [Brettanomyces nanus]
MTTPSSSPNKSTLTGWFKGLKASSTTNSHTSSQPSQPRLKSPLLSPSGASSAASALASPITSSINTPKNKCPAASTATTPSSVNPNSSATIIATTPSTNAPTTSTTVHGSTATQPRPKLTYKSRSSHTFRPLSSYFGRDSSTSSVNSNQQEQLKRQRDSFILQRQLDNIGNSPVFGVPLEESVQIAEGRIYISSDSNGLVVYGRIPRVVASCGLYLKKNALDIEGIFRMAGSNKRIKQLQIIFSTPPDYGAKIDWDGFTVHDAASLLRRYLGALPEPLIPLALYEDFREPLRSRSAILKYLKDKEKRMSHVGKEASKIKEQENSSKTGAVTDSAKQQSQEDREDKKHRKKLHKRKLIRERREALKDYADLLDKLPELRRQLLFYILDLLAIFNMHSEKNRMPAKNLAAIFQPSILSHSDHDLSPDEYALSSLVVEFMIEYSHKILPAAQESARLAAEAKKPKEAEEQAPEHGETERKGSEASSKFESLPPKSSYTTRKHSKSLSSVPHPSDMIRVTTSQDKLSMVKTDSIDDLGMTTEEEESSTRAVVVPVHPQVTLSQLQLEPPPPINVDNFTLPSSESPSHSIGNTLKPLSSPDTLHSSDSHSSDSHSPSHHFLHTLAKPLNILISPRTSPKSRSQSSATDDILNALPLSSSGEKNSDDSLLLNASASNVTESPSKENKGWLSKLRSRSNSKNILN